MNSALSLYQYLMFVPNATSLHLQTLILLQKLALAYGFPSTAFCTTRKSTNKTDLCSKNLDDVN